MGFFAWSDELSVGNTFIDNDHRRLISLVNGLYGAMEQGSGKDVQGKVLHGVIEYAQDHFKREETVMQRIGYVELASHKQEHNELIREVRNLQKKFGDGKSMLTIHVSALLRDWLFNHIVQVDKKLTAAMQEAGEAT